MKFKVGDKVRIKANCKVGKQYGRLQFLDSMKFDGVREVVDADGIKVKDKPFYYSPEMLEKADVPKYKVGDKVRVRSDLERMKNYYMEDHKHRHLTVDDMMVWVGKIVTIKYVSKDGYALHEAECFWTDEMFEGLVEEAPKSPKLKVGQKLRLRKDLATGWYDECWCTPQMVLHAGKIITIRELSDNDKIFYIEEDFENCSRDFTWSLGMTEPIEELEEVIDYVLFDMSPIPVIPTKPIVVIPVISDSFTKAWMESFIERNGGMAVNG